MGSSGDVAFGVGAPAPSASPPARAHAQRQGPWREPQRWRRRWRRQRHDHAATASRGGVSGAAAKTPLTSAMSVCNACFAFAMLLQRLQSSAMVLQWLCNASAKLLQRVCNVCNAFAVGRK